MLIHTGPEQNADRADAENAGPSLHLIAAYEGVWWPFRSIARTLFHAQRDRARMLALYQTMVAEAADIIRLEQDMVLQLSNRVFEQAPAARTGHSAAGDRHTDPRFDAAIACVRGLGQAVIDMQVAAIERMRECPPESGGEADLPATPTQQSTKLSGVSECRGAPALSNANSPAMHPRRKEYFHNGKVKRSWRFAG